MRRVAIVGIGSTKDPGNHHPFQTWKEILADSVYEAFADTQGTIKPRDIQAGVIAYHGEGVNEQGGIPGSATDLLGLSPIPFYSHCMNCAGGGVGINTGWHLVASGHFDKVLVTGFDKEGDHIHYGEVIQISFDTEYDYMFGLRHRDGIELWGKYYLEHYGHTYEALATMAQQFHWYARRNPKASYYGTPMMTWEEAMRPDSCASRMGEGSASAILVPADEAYKYTSKPVYLDGVSLTTTSHYVGHRFGEPSTGPVFPTDMKRTEYEQSSVLKMAANDAYKMAGIKPSDLSFAQIYDLLTLSLLEIEGLGLCDKGESPKFILDGGLSLTGKCPTNTDGGLIARGHSSGADGINQVVESVIQLRGEAGERQVPDASVGACTVYGGALAHVTVTVLRK